MLEYILIYNMDEGSMGSPVQRQSDKIDVLHQVVRDKIIDMHGQSIYGLVEKVCKKHSTACQSQISAEAYKSQYKKALKGRVLESSKKSLSCIEQVCFRSLQDQDTRVVKKDFKSWCKEQKKGGEKGIQFDLFDQEKGKGKVKSSTAAKEAVIIEAIMEHLTEANKNGFKGISEAIIKSEIYKCVKDNKNTPFIIVLMQRALMDGKSDLAKTIFDIQFPKGVEYIYYDSQDPHAERAVLQCEDPSKDHKFTEALAFGCEITCLKTGLLYPPQHTCHDGKGEDLKHLI